MNIPKAIETLNDAVVDPDTVSALDLCDATGLGVEALKLNLAMRETYHAPELLKLPSETEE